MTAIRHHDSVTPDVGGPPPQRSRWWWVAGAVLLLLVVVTAFILGRGGRTETPAEATPTMTVAAPPPASSVQVSAPPGAVGEDTPNPDGCLGGPDPYTAILPAQAAATLDAAGAAGFARAAVRYLLVQYPRPADYTTVIPQVYVDPGPPLARIANPQQAQQPQQPAPEGTTSKYVRPAETTYQVSVLGDRADVTVSVYMELDYPDGTPPNTVRLTQRLLLQAVDGHWRILDAPATDPAPPVGTGGFRYYPGGC
jgi:hypothetical protein